MRNKENLRAWRAKQRDHELELRNKRKENNYHEHWAGNCIWNHQDRGMVVEFTREWLTLKALDTPDCTICGSPLEWYPPGTPGCNTNTPTLDRISNERVLTTGNVMIVCNSCNAGKGTQSLDEYIAKCKRIAQRFNGDE